MFYVVNDNKIDLYTVDFDDNNFTNTCLYLMEKLGKEKGDIIYTPKLVAILFDIAINKNYKRLAMLNQLKCGIYADIYLDDATQLNYDFNYEKIDSIFNIKKERVYSLDSKYPVLDINIDELLEDEFSLAK